jgi:hypothetical protein
MSNTKAIRIVADVPFDYMNWHDPREGRLPAEEQAAIASVLVAPSGGLGYEYAVGAHRRVAAQRRGDVMTPLRCCYRLPRRDAAGRGPRVFTAAAEKIRAALERSA